jgi:signal transduction histidine kinase
LSDDATLAPWKSDEYPASAASPSSVEALLQEEQVRALFERGLTPLIVNLLNALVLVAALWPALHHGRVLVWLATMYGVVVVRLLFWRSHQRDVRAPYAAEKWVRIWSLGTFATGALWGAAVWLLSSAEFGLDENLVLFLIGGMVAGASASMSSFAPAFVAFAAPALTPPIIRLFTEGDRIHLAMAALLVSFGIAMTAITRGSGRAFADSVRLRLRNSRLVQELTSAREALSGLNLELEERIKQRTQQLQQTLSERDQFVSVISHELRTPLTSMRLNQEILARTFQSGSPDAGEVERRFGTLRRQMQRMQRLLEDLLDVSRLSTHRMRYRKEPVEMKTIVEAALDEMGPQLAVAGVSFRIDVPEGLRGEWDAGRLQQVFINLMSNAVRHGKAPFALTARREGASVEVDVKDAGGSIPTEALGRIFRAFERAEGPPTSEGLGLGLYIADQIVQAHEGSILAKSSIGRGTTFVIQLPLLSPQWSGSDQ